MAKFLVSVVVEAQNVGEVAGLFAYDSDGEPYENWQSLSIEPYDL